jgi:hypothetical protein
VFGLGKQLGGNLPWLRLKSLTHKTQSAKPNKVLFSPGIEPSLLLIWFLHFSLGVGLEVMLLEGKELRIFIPMNGAKMGFSGDMGDWAGVSC